MIRFSCPLPASPGKGPEIFLGRLVDALEKKGHLRVADSEDQDIRLGLIVEDIEKWHAMGIPVLLRMDGICHRSDLDFAKENANVASAFAKADGIIYQTEFSKQMCLKYLGTPKTSLSSVIMNGFELPADFAEIPHPANGHPFVFTAAQWRPHKRLADSIRGFLEWGNKEAVLFVAGIDSLPLKDPRVIPLGILSERQMLPYYKHALAFLHLCWLDWCPNTVVESIACGTPVICTSNGGTKEIVRESGIIIEEAQYDGEPCLLYKPPKVPPQEVAKALEQIKAKAYNAARSDLSMQTVAEHYLEMMQRVLTEGNQHLAKRRTSTKFASNTGTTDLQKEGCCWPLVLKFPNVSKFIDRADLCHSRTISTERALSLLDYLVQNFELIDEPQCLEMIKNPLIRRDGKLLITLDDANEMTLRILAPEIKRRGIRPILFIPANILGDEKSPTSSAQIKELLANGWSIGCSRGLSNHPLTALDPEQLVLELRDSKRILEAEFGVELKSLAYPQGLLNDSVLSSAGKFYSMGFLSSATHKLDSILQIPRLDATQELQIRNCRIPADATLSDLELCETPDFGKQRPVTNGIAHLDGAFLGTEESQSLSFLDSLKKPALRIVLVCGNGPAERKLASEIAGHYNLAGLVIENSGSTALLGRTNTPGNFEFRNKWFEFESEEQARLLGPESMLFLVEPWTPVFSVDTIANPELREIITELAPELVLICGISDEGISLSGIETPIYSLIPCLSRLHQGRRAVLRPLLEERPELLGGTLIKLPEGAIIEEVRPCLSGGESALEIEYKIFREAIKSFKKIIGCTISCGQAPAPYELNVAFQQKDEWTPEEQEHTDMLLANGLLFRKQLAIAEAEKNLPLLNLKAQAGFSVAPTNTVSVTPMVSVVMGVYNGERYLTEAVESILAQSYRDFEFIIIDDASSDKTPEILTDYAKRDARVKVFRLENNSGLTKALNHGIKKSSGRFIARQDADDISLPGRLAAQLAYLEKNPEIALCGTQICSGPKINGELDFVSTLPRSPLICRIAMLSWGGCHPHGSVMFRRDALENANLYDETIPVAQDYDLMLRISESQPTANLITCHYFYRTHQEQISARKAQEQTAILAEAKEKAYAKMLSKSHKQASESSPANDQEASSILAAFLNGHLKEASSTDWFMSLEPSQNWRDAACEYISSCRADFAEETNLDNLLGSVLPPFLSEVIVKTLRPGLARFAAYARREKMPIIVFPAGRFCRRWLPLLKSCFSDTILGYYDEANHESIPGLKELDPLHLPDTKNSLVMIMARSDAGLLELKAKRLFPGKKYIHAPAAETNQPELLLNPLPPCKPISSCRESVLWEAYVENVCGPLWNSLAKGEKIALFGAGAHTQYLLPLLLRKGWIPEFIIDDEPKFYMLMGCPVIHSSKLSLFREITKILISSDSSHLRLREALRKRPEFKGLEIVDIYGDMPEMPFEKA
ncbi:MAG: hypothetical protein A2X49_00575 [Lentisphaerae bacterium GWF2_52_8]|nr:MAG: hypothetical protein A2X49_00575 [Lentisphaerae bacterium GWF2_52_8]